MGGGRDGRGEGVTSRSGITRLIRANHLSLESHAQFLEDGGASERGPASPCSSRGQARHSTVQ